MGVAVQGGSVAFYDLPNSPKIKVNRDTRSATRVGHVAWSDIDALILECFGTAPALPGVYPGIAYLYVNSLDIGPFHEDAANLQTCTGGVATYSGMAMVSIGYETLPYESDTLITRRWSMNGEFLTIPSGSLEWEDRPGKKVQEEEISAAKIIPMTEHSLTRNRAISIPWTAIKDNIGKVNDGVLNNGWFTNVAAETLLYMGAEINYTFSTDGTQVYTLEHRFNERRVQVGASTYGWQHVLRPDDSTWVRLLDANGDPMYPESADFDDLFA